MWFLRRNQLPQTLFCKPFTVISNQWDHQLWYCTSLCGHVHHCVLSSSLMQSYTLPRLLTASYPGGICSLYQPHAQAIPRPRAKTEYCLMPKLYTAQAAHCLVPRLHTASCHACCQVTVLCPGSTASCPSYCRAHAQAASCPSYCLVPKLLPRAHAANCLVPKLLPRAQVTATCFSCLVSTVLYKDSTMAAALACGASFSEPASCKQPP